MDRSIEITRLLREMKEGSNSARDRLFDLLYDDLRRRARAQMARQVGPHTLQTTALIHEVFLRVARDRGTDWSDREHFFRVAVRAMRSVLVDHARKRRSAKRGGSHQRVPMFEVSEQERPLALDMIALDGALTELGQKDAQAAAVVELKFFAGQTIAEVAELLQVSHSTVERDWAFARAWLRSRVG